MVIRFWPGKLSTKPDTLTCHWDIYPKEGSSDYASINPQNLRPIFTDKQLASSLCTTTKQFSQCLKLFQALLGSLVSFGLDEGTRDLQGKAWGSAILGYYWPVQVSPR